MSGFGESLSVEELAAAVFHERSQFGGDQITADGITEEFEVIEQFIVVAEEEGVTSLRGLTVDEIGEMLDTARSLMGAE